MKFKPTFLLGLYCGLYLGTAAAAVNIAVIAPTDGDFAVSGREIISGVRIAVNEINDNGGLNGEKINLIEIEDACNDSLAVSTAQMMALNTTGEYRAATVIGPYCANKSRQVADTFAKAGIFQIIPTASSETHTPGTAVSQPEIVGYKEQMAEDFFNFYNQKFPWIPVSVIFDNAHQETAQALQKVFAQNNKADNLQLYNLEENNFDYDKITAAARAAKSEIAFILSDAEHTAQMAKELKSKKRKYVIFANRYQVMPVFETIMGSLTDGCYFMGLPSFKNNPEFTETLVKLRLLGIKPEGLSMHGYAAVNLWTDLVRKADSFKSEKLQQVLKDNRFTSDWSKLLFIKGNPLNTLNYSIYRFENGEYAQVY